MATIPQVTPLTASSVDILNAIRNDATQAYKNYVPIATQIPSNSKEIGQVLMQFPALQNEFVSALVNRIGLVIVKNMSFSNPWSVFKRGILDFGETIEEIFVEIAKPFQYDPASAYANNLKRQLPDVRAAFHPINYKKFYKVTIQQEELQLAFLSWDGVNNLITKIVDSLYKGAEYDEFLVMKFCLAKHIVNGHLYPMEKSGNTTTSAAKDYKTVSNNMLFPSTLYNMAGVRNTTPRDEQYLIMTAAADAEMDVDVLAAAFNMEKAEFMGHRVLVDSFSVFDTERLAELFADDPNYVALTDGELAILAKVQAVILDKDFFMIYDNLLKFTEDYIGEGIYWNYWYHVWKTFSVSPFANAVVIVDDVESEVTAITVTPATATIAGTVGNVLHLVASVTKAGLANSQVVWSISSNAEGYARIDESGNLIITDIPSSDLAITVTATSVFDSTVSGTATITLDV